MVVNENKTDKWIGRKRPRIKQQQKQLKFTNVHAQGVHFIDDDINGDIHAEISIMEGLNVQIP